MIRILDSKTYLMMEWGSLVEDGWNLKLLCLFKKHLNKQQRICLKLVFPDIAEGNGNSIQYSGLENPIDRGV